MLQCFLAPLSPADVGVVLHHCERGCCHRWRPASLLNCCSVQCSKTSQLQRLSMAGFVVFAPVRPLLIRRERCSRVSPLCRHSHKQLASGTKTLESKALGAAIGPTRAVQHLPGRRTRLLTTTGARLVPDWCRRHDWAGHSLSSSSSPEHFPAQSSASRPR